MSREWLITLEGYTSTGGTVQYIYFKDGEGYESLRHDSEDTTALKTCIKNNSDLVSEILNKVGGWLAVKEVPLKYADFWRQAFKKENRQYPTGEFLD